MVPLMKNRLSRHKVLRVVALIVAGHHLMCRNDFAQMRETCVDCRSRTYERVLVSLTNISHINRGRHEDLLPAARVRLRTSIGVIEGVVQEHLGTTDIRRFEHPQGRQQPWNRTVIEKWTRSSTVYARFSFQ